MSATEIVQRFVFFFFIFIYISHIRLIQGAKLRFRPQCTPNQKIFDAYRSALDQSVKLSTKHNVEPITGATAVKELNSIGMTQAIADYNL
jgi:hypothetical protein